MSDTKPFLWAQGEQANVKEPIPALQVHGWRYGDVPAASNFNWLFKMMTEELAGLRKDVLHLREDLVTKVDEQDRKFSAALAQQTRTQDNKIAEVAAQTKSLDGRVTRVHNTHKGNAKQLATSIEVTWENLRSFDARLRAFVPGLPITPWPSSVGIQSSDDNEP